MHTHSENSHDSVCKIEDMCLSQIGKGTEIFAVTDHFDTESFLRYDVFAPIANAYQTVEALRQKYGNACLLLSGVEISEGFWYPDVYKKVRTLVDYDVVIGSVHLVRYPDLCYAYSGIDFSRLARDTVIGYLDAYFDDVMTMIETVDFDILAHLTCPLRYINGMYKMNVDLARFADKIDEILFAIIRRGIALEVNTSSFRLLNDVMPSADVLRRYFALGGRLITLGSDAHVADNASCHFEKAEEILRQIGFENTYYYQNRQAHPIALLS